MGKWGKTLLATIGGAFAGTIGQWANTYFTGGHEPFTAKTIVIPAVMTIVSTILALFTKSPTQA